MKICTFYTTFFFLCTSFLFSACSLKTVHRWEEPIKPGKLNFVWVAEIISGDVIKLQDGRMIKYNGILTPPSIAQKSKAANEWLLRTGSVLLEFGEPQQDNQGRYLAYVYAPSQKGLCFVNQELLEFGYCDLDPDFADPKYLGEFRRLQQQAKKNKQGVWASPNF